MFSNYYASGFLGGIAVQCQIFYQASAVHQMDTQLGFLKIYQQILIPLKDIKILGQLIILFSIMLFFSSIVVSGIF